MENISPDTNAFISKVFMDRNTQDVILALLRMDRTRYIGHVSSESEITRDMRDDKLSTIPDMRSLVDNYMLLGVQRLGFSYNENESSKDKLVFINDAFTTLIEELKSLLYKKVATIDSLEDYLLRKGFSSDDLDYIEGGLSNVPGFLMMNNTITFRGENFVAPIPPNQNPVNHEEIMKKYLGNK